MKTKAAIGVGFAGVDIIKYCDNEVILPGGTTGNVMSALASLNWRSSLLRSRNTDQLNCVVTKLWNSISVNLIECGVTRSPLPRIIEVLETSKNTQYSVCPECGRKLTTISLPSVHSLKKQRIDYSKFNLLFYDRVSDVTKYLLEIFRRNNQWSFYEPNSARNFEVWKNNVMNSDIIKFSDDRISLKSYARLVDNINTQQHNTKIILITHASRGFSYSTSNGERLSELTRVNVEQFKDVVDSTGAGDWLSAGFIDKLTDYYSSPVFDMDEEAVVTSLYHGHSLAKTACKHVGALGYLFQNKQTEIPRISSECNFCKSV